MAQDTSALSLRQPTAPQIIPTPAAPTAADFEALADLARRFPFLFGAVQQDRTTAAEIIDKYMADAPNEISDRTLETRGKHLEAFRAAFGDMAVVDMKPFHLREFIEANRQRWPAVATRRGVKVSINRCFNWAVQLGYIDRNPIRGWNPPGETNTGRDMKPDELQAVLRHTDPNFRRFLITLKLTGARPGELSQMKWEQIDWHRGVAVLDQHKTRKKTGKARQIWLVPQVLKLLAIIRRDELGPAAVELRRILLSAPDRTARVERIASTMRALGFSYRQIYRAQVTIGATKRRVGGWHKHGYTVYCLPDNATPQEPTTKGYVFVHRRGKPYNRYTLGEKFARIRRKVGLPADCKLYSLRHFFITWACKRGVEALAVAKLAGHQSLDMILRVYAHVDGDHVYMQAAAAKATALVGAPNPLPLPVDAKAEAALKETKYPRAQPKPAKKPRPRVLLASQRDAFDSWQCALKRRPEFARANDHTIYAWLRGQPDMAGKIPPSLSSWRRYLNEARRLLGQATRRPGRPRTHHTED